MENIIFSHAAEETSIQSLVPNFLFLFFIFIFLFSSFSLYSLSAEVPLAAFHNIEKYTFSDKVTLASSTELLANKIMRLANYYFGIISSHTCYDKPWEQIMEKLLAI